MIFVFCVSQAASQLDARPHFNPVVLLSSCLPAYELLLRRKTDCRGRPPNPQPQTGATHHQPQDGAMLVASGGLLSPKAGVLNPDPQEPLTCMF